MKSDSLDRWLLVNYVGYPYAPNSLMPDNGLASLAGVLLDAGKEVRILDFATVNVLEKFTSPASAIRLQAIWNALFPSDGSTPGSLRKSLALASLLRAESKRARRQAVVLTEICNQVVEQVKHEAIQAVGFKLWNGDGLGGSAAIAQAIRRECPQIRLFGGGPQVDFFMELILDRFASFDALTFGEGEETLRALAESGGGKRTYRDIPNLIFRNDGQTIRTESRIVGDLNDLPRPVYDPAVYTAMEGHDKIKIAVIDESRGCGNNCAFCIHPIKSDHRLRAKSIDRLTSEVDDLSKLYGIRTFRFAGSCTPYRLLNEFAEAMIARHADCIYSSFAHVRESTSANFENMRQSGAVALFFGIESGAQTVLDAMRKGTRIDDIRTAVDGASRAGIQVVGSLIYPAPGDTEQTRAETLKLLSELPLSAINVTSPLVVPRSDWFNHPERYGISFEPAAYLRAAMDWKVKILLPPQLWKSLPVSVGGRCFKQILKATGDFLHRVEEMGFITSCPDDLCLMAERSGIGLHEFRDESRQALFAGDADRVRELVERINARA